MHLQNQYLCNRRTGNITQLFRTSKEILVLLACFSVNGKYYLCAIFKLSKISLTFVLYTGENNEWLIVEAQIHGNWKDMVAISSVDG